IDEIKEQDEAKTYYTKEGDQDDDPLFYNPWTDVFSNNNPAVYIVLTAEVPTTPLLTVNTSLNRQQREKFF
ncbi:29964_t:CDS:1, partial [Racocetra persica]